MEIKILDGIIQTANTFPFHGTLDLPEEVHTTSYTKASGVIVYEVQRNI